MQNDKRKYGDDFTKRLIKVTVDVIRYCESLKHYRFLWGVFDQLIDSCSSMGANREEAKSSSSKRDFIKFFEIALKSANETKFWLMVVIEVAKDSVEKQRGAELLSEVSEIANILGSSIITLKGKRNL